MQLAKPYIQLFHALSSFPLRDGWVDIQVALAVKNLPATAGDLRDTSLIPGLGRSPGGGHGNPLQYSYLEIPWTKEPGRLRSIGSQKVGHN